MELKQFGQKTLESPESSLHSLVILKAGATSLVAVTSIQEQFLHKQSLEMTGLTKRIVSGREERVWQVVSLEGQQTDRLKGV